MKGYKMLVVMPNGMSHVNDALAEARRLGSLPGYFAPQQFDNEWNVDENREWLGQEIFRQLPVKPDLVIGGIDTGGTIIGVGQALMAANPECKVIALEPAESCTILCGEIAKHLIEWIADGFVPGIVRHDREFIDDFVDVNSDEAIVEMRRLSSEHGILVGPSSGVHLLAAHRPKEQYQVEHVVTFFCDEGENYINDYWLQ